MPPALPFGNSVAAPGASKPGEQGCAKFCALTKSVRGEFGSQRVPPDSASLFRKASMEKAEVAEELEEESAGKEATTVAGRQGFQGRVLRVHFDEDAPPGCAVATVVGRTRAACAP